MKILANPEVTLVQQHQSFRLPHLAIEVDVRHKDLLQDGQQLSFSNYKFNLSAFVFKPGDGSRLILKNFTIEYISVLAPTWIEKLLGLCLIKSNVYHVKSQDELVQDISHFINNAGVRLLYLGKVSTIISVD